MLQLKFERHQLIISVLETIYLVLFYTPHVINQAEFDTLCIIGQSNFIYMNGEMKF